MKVNVGRNRQTWAVTGTIGQNQTELGRNGQKLTLSTGMEGHARHRFQNEPIIWGLPLGRSRVSRAKTHAPVLQGWCIRLTGTKNINIIGSSSTPHSDVGSLFVTLTQMWLYENFFMDTSPVS